MDSQSLLCVSARWDITGSTHTFVLPLAASNETDGVRDASSRSVYLKPQLDRNHKHGLYWTYLAQYNAIIGGQIYYNNGDASTYQGVCVAGDDNSIIGARIGDAFVVKLLK